MTREQAIRVISMVDETIGHLKDYMIGKMEEPDKSATEYHVAFSVAVEALRAALVLQYDETHKEMIFKLAEHWLTEPELIRHSENKA